MQKKLLLLFLLFLGFTTTYAQERRPLLKKGDLTLGLRTTTSLFGHDPVPGLGTGGHFRLQLFDKVSTEWFADWITMDLKGAGTRNNAHIGWSVLFYPKKEYRYGAYLMAGHCFDYAEITPLSTALIDRSSEKISRGSSAVQAGAGAHYFLSDHFNVTFSAQYMLHLGGHLDYELQPVGENYFLDTDHDHTEAPGAAFEGHLLLTLSLNYKIATLW